MHKTVKKAVIPAAGLGTRFLPATKAIPKELLPIVDVPTIQYIVEEAVESGIDTICLVSGRGKDAIEDHFDVHKALEDKLESQGKEKLLQKLRSTNQMADVVSIRQGIPKGLGHAILCAKVITNNEPFAVLLGDDIVDSDPPCTRQMIEAYDKYQKSVVALMEVSDQDVSKFGICAGKEIEDGVIEIDQMVEKPNLEEAPSNLAIVGRYILSPAIMDMLEETKEGKGGEIQLTDAMHKLMKKEGFIGIKVTGERHDAGDTFGFVKANIAYALKRDDIAPKLKEYIKELAKSV
ncbi:UNVERIFIED_CONTAM: hypothetical protein GTU68_001745 [Idotea baltica]|nr:hypothetical protein [Idotea baltica]